MEEKKKIIMKEEVQGMPDRQILDIVDNAKGHTGKEFGETYGCDFSYNFLLNELKRRGYINGWYRPADVNEKKEIITESESRNKEICKVVVNDEPKDKIRTSVYVEPSVWKRWQLITAGMPGKAHVLSEALERFMRDVKSGTVCLSWNTDE